MSLDNSLSEFERSKLAVWDYPVSDKYTKVMQNQYAKTNSEFQQFSVDLAKYEGG